MMKYIAIIALFLMSFVSHAQQLLLPHNVSYGVVVSHTLHQPPANYARGSLLGAITGGVVVHKDRGWGALGGALIGAGLEHAIANGQAAHHLIIKLNAGDSFSIAMPNTPLDTGDCVAVTRTEAGADLTKVAQTFCQEDTSQRIQSQPSAPSSTRNAVSKEHIISKEHSTSQEQQCAQARSQLTTASDKQYNRVLADVQRLCQ